MFALRSSRKQNGERKFEGRQSWVPGVTKNDAAFGRLCFSGSVISILPGVLKDSILRLRSSLLRSGHEAIESARPAWDTCRMRDILVDVATHESNRRLISAWTLSHLTVVEAQTSFSWRRGT